MSENALDSEKSYNKRHAAQTTEGERTRENQATPWRGSDGRDLTQTKASVVASLQSVDTTPMGRGVTGTDNFRL